MNQESSKANVIVNSFSRIEDKFVLPKELLPQFVSLLGEHLQRSYGSEAAEGSDDTGNQSIYFDSQNVECFQQHFEKFDKRFKIRIRRYRVNGVWDDKVVFVECKFKIHGTSSKQRFLLSRVGFEQLMAGIEIEVTPELFSLNSSMKKESLLKRVNEVNQLVQRLEARPKLIVEYHRTAFEKGDLRVTIDRGIKTLPLGELSNEVADNIKKAPLWEQALQMQRIFDNQENCLVEIKHSGQHPEWFDEFMVRHSIIQSSFSKYCWGMGQAIASVKSEKVQEHSLLRARLEYAKTSTEVKGEPCSLAVY